MRILSTILALSIAALSTNALAWNDRGHMMVAAVAWDNMEFETRARASALIRDHNPHYERLIADAKPWNRDKIAFMRAATWPDMLRGMSNYVDDGINPENSTKAPEPNRNTGYDDLYKHRYWHFVDLPFSTDGSKKEDPKKPNALTRIILHRDTLASSTANDDLKSYDLVWLLHLVGDVHQPLHGAQRFSALSQNGDAGGNSVILCEAKACTDHNTTSLHSFWDNSAGKTDNVFAAIKAAGELDEPSSEAAAIDDPEIWIKESFEFAKADVYRAPILETNGPFPIGANSNYKARARDLANERIALAGVRLANLLDGFLK